MLRKFFIWLVKSLIALVLITFVFSTVALDVPNLVKGIFNDIFQYASPEVQKEIVGKLTTTCSKLDKESYDKLQQASDMQMPLDFSKIGALCKDYNSGKVNDKEFFFGVIGNTFPEKLELPKINALEKYNAIMDALNKNKIIYFAVLAVLFILLYLLVMDIKVFITTLTGISFSMGILILAPYVAAIAYDKFAGINTTPILAIILGGDISFDAKAIISVIFLMILRVYSSFILTLGILFFGIGIAGKIYNFMLKRKEKTAKTKPKKVPLKKKHLKKTGFLASKTKKTEKMKKLSRRV